MQYSKSQNNKLVETETCTVAFKAKTKPKTFKTKTRKNHRSLDYSV